MKRSKIETLMPSVFQRTCLSQTPLAAVLEVMERLHDPSEDILKNLDRLFNSRLTPDSFVPLLASWVDLERIFECADADQKPSARTQTISTGLGRLRELVAEAGALSKWRGTARGLLRFLEIATGEVGRFSIIENQDANGRSRQFHIVVFAPASLRSHRALLDRIIRSEKPACVTYDLVMQA